MKTFLRTFLLIIIFSTSCEKLEIKHDLVGTWRLIAQDGGFTGSGCGATFTNLILKRNDEFSFLRNDSTIESGTYKITKNDIQGFQTDRPYLLKLTANFPKNFGTIILAIRVFSMDTIHLSDPNPDGCGFYFTRQ